MQTQSLNKIYNQTILKINFILNMKLANILKNEKAASLILMAILMPIFIMLIACFLQVKIPHFCKYFSPGTSGEFFR